VQLISAGSFFDDQNATLSFQNETRVIFPRGAEIKKQMTTPPSTDGVPMYITCTGLIGAGKSTLSKALGAYMHLPVFAEPVEENPYLKLFYGDMAKHAFAMQVYLLNERFRQQQQIVWQNNGAVQDRSIYEDGVFALMLRDAGLMSELDYKTYTALFRHMSNFMKRPTLIVFLDVTPEEALRRIKLRGRECEAGITLEYLMQLHAAYQRFIVDISRTIPVLRVKYEQFISVEEMAAGVEHYYKTMGTVHEF
jgi:deoxyadenosine kinase